MRHFLDHYSSAPNSFRRSFVSKCCGVAIGLAAMSGPMLGHGQEAVAVSDAGYLDGLKGSWDMVGTFGDKPVRYLAEGASVLQGGFVRLHMLDASSPPRYEADLFIGFDPQKKDYIAHWLDRFGAAGARVVGRGTRNGPTLIVMFPYADGAFRDTFNWDAAHRSWSLLLESQGNDGSWSTFATYVLSRKAAR